MNWFNNLKLSVKIMGISIITIGLILCSLFFLLLPIIEGQLMHEKQNTLTFIVEVAYSIVADYGKLAAAGTMPADQAKARAMADIRAVRYGGNEYCWINDMNGFFVMHPTNKDVDGKDGMVLKDTNGKFYVAEFVRVAKEKGEGFVDYWWVKAGATAASPKLSYIKLYRDWGWVIGTGIYIDDVNEQMTALRVQILTVTAIIMIGILAIAFIVTRSITTPLRHAVLFAGNIASGDLTQRIHGKYIARRDEVGGLSKSLDEMSGKLADIVQNIVSGANNVSSGSEQMSAASQQLSQGSTEQASSAEEVSSSMEEMGANIQQNADNSLQTEKIALKAAEDATKGGDSINKSVNAMKEIASKIMIIEEIARNTNLLALNAAIEAARAGEHGKGFAVVASEVRKLAERSQKAAAEISDLSKSSVEISVQAGDMFQKIIPDIKRTAELVQEISAASREQNSGVDQINRAIMQLDQVIQQNAASSEELASMSEELSSQAEQLQSTISFFRTAEQNQGSTIQYQAHNQTLLHQPPPANRFQDKQRSTTVINAHAPIKKTTGVRIDLSEKSNKQDELDKNFKKFE